MKIEEIEICQRVLTGHWPTPAFTADEQTVWTRTLAHCDYAKAVDVIDAMAATGAKWRPNDGEFLATYRQRGTQRPAMPPRAELVDPPMRKDLVRYWKEHIQLQMEGKAGVAHSTEEMLAMRAERDCTEALLKATAPKDGRLDYGSVI